MFEALVKEGVTLQKKTQTVAEDKFSEVSSKMTGMANEVQAKAGQQWDKLESIFEERTAKALGKLGVPSAKDVGAMQSRIDELSAKVAKLAKGAPAKTASAKPAAKAAAKPAVKAAAKRPARKAA